MTSWLHSSWSLVCVQISSQWWLVLLLTMDLSFPWLTSESSYRLSSNNFILYHFISNYYVVWSTCKVDPFSNFVVWIFCFELIHFCYICNLYAGLVVIDFEANFLRTPFYNRLKLYRGFSQQCNNFKWSEHHLHMQSASIPSEVPEVLSQYQLETGLSSRLVTWGTFS